MVWVPDLALRPDFWGVGSALPRAVPSDLVVAFLDEVLPGMLLQKLVLLGGLVLGGTGASRLVADLPVAARCVAASVYVWNPFVVERLVIGHWPVLVGYAALPWLVLAATAYRRDGRIPSPLWWLLPLGSLSAAAGIATAVVVLAFGLSRPRRRTLRLLALLAVANAPWLVAGALHAGAAVSDADGAAAFAPRGEGPLVAPLATLGLGGIWNSEVVPATREGPLVVLALLVLLLLAVAGGQGWLRAEGPRDRAAYLVCWCVGWGVALLTWVSTDLTGWLAASLPGGGILRDGSRLLGLCAPLVAVLVAHGAARLGAAFQGAGQRTAVLWMLALAPFALMPDAAWGVDSRLEAVSYPSSYDEAREAVGDADGTDLLVLPFTSYRAPGWNGGRKVLDPLGRYLAPDYVASDELIVSGVRISGEDPRGEDVRRALDKRTPEARTAALTDLGIGTVVVDRTAIGPASRVAGQEAFSDATLKVLDLDADSGSGAPVWWLLAMVVAWTAWFGLPLVGLGLIVLRGARWLRSVDAVR
jgi:hypothetical protein